LPHNTTYHIIEDPTTGNLYAATSSVHDIYEPRPARLNDSVIDSGEGYVIMSSDKGQSWQLLKDLSHPVIWLAMDPSDSDTLYASVVHSTEGGIYVTHNLSSGTSAVWTKLNSPARTEGHPFNIHVLNDGSLLVSYSARLDASGAFTESSGVFISSDGGSTWEDRSHTNMRRWTKDIVVDPNDSSQKTWYAAVFGHWGTAPIDVGGLYRTTDQGLNWTRISTLERVESCTIHPDNSNVLYLSTETQGLWRTENLGSATPTFTQVEAYPFKQPVRIFFNPYNHDEIWATSYGGGLRVQASGGGTAAPQVSFTGLRNDLTQTPTVGESVTFTASAVNVDPGSIYYRFDIIPDYGTEAYDPLDNWQTIQAFSTATTCTHTFSEAGSYVIVVWASSTQNIPTGAAPIFGGSVTVGDDSTVVINSLNISPTGTLQTGQMVTFTASAAHPTGGDIYYRFDLVPNYGTSSYDPNNNYQTIQDFSTNGTCTYTFTESGSYIIVVWASSTASIPTDMAPAIIGGSITVQ
jgi:hypothetical protein